MKKISCFVMIIVIIGVASMGIYTLLYRDNFSESVKSTTTVIEDTEKGYELLSESTNFKEFQFTRKLSDDFTVSFFDNELSYKNHMFFINGKKIVEGVSILRHFALYNDSRLILLVNYEEKFNDGILTYNMMNNESEVIDLIDGKFVLLDQNSYFESYGLSFMLTKVYEDQYYMNQNFYAICSLGKVSGLVASENVEYLYDYNEKRFTHYDVVSSLNLESYKLTNHLCN